MMRCQSAAAAAVVSQDGNALPCITKLIFYLSQRLFKNDYTVFLA